MLQNVNKYINIIKSGKLWTKLKISLNGFIPGNSFLDISRLNQTNNIRYFSIENSTKQCEAPIYDFKRKIYRTCKNFFRDLSSKYCYLHKIKSTDSCKAVVFSPIHKSYNYCKLVSKQKKFCLKHLNYNYNKYFQSFLEYTFTFSSEKLIFLKNLFHYILNKIYFKKSNHFSNLFFIFLKNHYNYFCYILNLNNLNFSPDGLHFFLKIIVGWTYYKGEGPLRGFHNKFQLISVFFLNHILKKDTYRFLYCSFFNLKLIFIFLSKNNFWVHKKVPVLSSLISENQSHQIQKLYNLSTINWKPIFDQFPEFSFYTKNNDLNLEFIVLIIIKKGLHIFKFLKKDRNDFWLWLLKITKEIMILTNFVFKKFSNNPDYLETLNLAELKFFKKKFLSNYIFKKIFFQLFLDRLISDFFKKLKKNYPRFNFIPLQYGLVLVPIQEANFFLINVSIWIFKKYSIISLKKKCNLLNWILVPKSFFKYGYYNFLLCFQSYFIYFFKNIKLGCYIYLIINEKLINDLLQKWKYTATNISDRDFVVYFRENNPIIFIPSHKKSSKWEKASSLNYVPSYLITEMASLLSKFNLPITDFEKLSLSSQKLLIKNMHQVIHNSHDILRSSIYNTDFSKSILLNHKNNFFSALHSEIAFSMQLSNPKNNTKFIFWQFIRVFEIFFFFLKDQCRDLLILYPALLKFPDWNDVEIFTKKFLSTLNFENLFDILVLHVTEATVFFRKQLIQDSANYIINLDLSKSYIPQPNLIAAIQNPLLIHLFEMFLEFLNLENTELLENILLRFGQIFKNNSWMLINQSYPIIYKFLFFLESAQVVIKANVQWKSSDYSKWGANLYVVFPNLNANDFEKVILLKNVPLLLPPENLNLLSLEKANLIKPLHGGESSQVFSNQTIASLNISQQKKYKINKDYLILLLKLNKSTNSKLNLPFATDLQILNKKIALDRLSVTLNSVKRYEVFFKFIKWIRNQQNWSLNIAKTFQLFRRLLNISINELNLYKHYLALKKELVVLVLKKNKFLQTTALANSLINFPLFYGTALDYRLRMYPAQELFSRTSGYLKYLVTSYEKKSLTVNDFVMFLFVYYSNETFLKEKLSILVKKCEMFNLKTVKVYLIKFFYLHKINLNNVKNYLYFSLIEIEITKVIRSKFFWTDFCIEIDQSASGPSLLAKLIGNKKLAYWCNWISPAKKDIYNYLMKNLPKILKQIKKDYSNNTKIACDFLCADREFLKQALMKFFYNQVWLGRFKSWKQLILKLFGPQKEEIWNELKWIAINFERVLDKLFPNLAESMSLLNKIFKLSIDYTGSIWIKSLDGSLISWKFLAQESKTAKFWNNTTQEFRSFRYQISTGNTNRISQDRLLRSAIPGLMHCLDGSIVRIILKKMFEQHKIILTHLHDSFSCEVPYLNKLYEILSSFYKNFRTKNWLKELLINPLMEKLEKLTDSYPKFQLWKLCNQLNALNKRITTRYFNPKNMYPPEK